MQRSKRFLLFFIVITIILTSSFLLTTNLFAADGVDSEPNNNADSAETISFRGASGEEKVVGAVGKIGSSGDEDWYKINLTAGTYSVTLTNNNSTTIPDLFGLLPADYDIYIYNYANRNNLNNYLVRSIKSGTTPEQCSFTISSTGDYYIRVDGYLTAYSSTVSYKMMMSKGDTAYMMEGQRYRFFPHVFYGRLSSGTEYNTTGVAYTYGGKDTLSTYESKMTEADSYKSSPFDNWSKYSTSHPRPGRWKTELDSGLPAYTNQSLWAGIDCSALIWMCTVSSDITYVLESYSVGDVSTTLINNSTVSTATTFANSKIGTIYVKPADHVVSISRLATAESNCYIIHATGSSPSRKTREDSITAISYGDYNRKNLN